MNLTFDELEVCIKAKRIIAIEKRDDGGIQFRVANRPESLIKYYSNYPEKSVIFINNGNSIH